MILNKQLALKDNTINVISDIQGYAWLKENGFETLTSKVNGGRTPMHIACKKGHLDICQWLFEVGATEDISKADNDGRMPMHIACYRGHLHICQWLVANGATEDITKAIKSGWTPMYAACKSGNLDICQWLFANGATEDITKASKSEWTPMYAACKSGNLELCQWLFDNGATEDISKAEKYGGRTPFHTACFEGNLDMCKWLLLNGALNHTNTYSELYKFNQYQGMLTKLNKWALETLKDSDNFKDVFLLGTLTRNRDDGTLTRNRDDKRLTSKHLRKLRGHAGLYLKTVQSFLLPAKQKQNLQLFVDTNSPEKKGSDPSA